MEVEKNQFEAKLSKLDQQKRVELDQQKREADELVKRMEDQVDWIPN